MAVIACASGCVESNAPFKVVDRASTEEDGRTIYLVHVGDRPTLRFGGRTSSPDYVIVKDETTGRYEDAGFAIDGIFEWPRAFDELPQGEDIVTLTALGYRQNQHRDFMPSEGRLEETDPAFDAPDELVTSGRLQVRVYQSRIVLEVPPQDGSIDWNLSWIDLTTAARRRTRVRYSADGQRGAFTAVRDEATGGWRVEYEPALDEIDLNGPTRVELNVADDYGKPTKLETQWSPQ